ncbi:MAG: TonB-dependent receptor plug domain-containing protein [Desulfobulbus sp.]|jgi:iron complex outermembrane receptor protein
MCATPLRPEGAVCTRTHRRSGKRVLRTRLALLAAATVIGMLPCWPTGASAKQEYNEYLELGLTQLMDVIVTTVSKSEQSLVETPAAVFVITPEDIRRSGATTIADTLAMVPGVHVGRATGSLWSVSARGFGGYTANKVLALIDGRSLYSTSYSGVWWDAQHVMLEDIERIEVVRGPGGSLWGANAVNGVVNVITKKAQDTQGTLVRVGGGNQQPLTAAARHGGKIGDAAYLRLYAARDGFAANTLPDGTDANDNWYSHQGGFRMDGVVGDSNKWTLQGDIYQDRKEQLIYPLWTQDPPYQGYQESEIEVEGHNLLGRLRRDLSKGRALTVQAYYDYVHRIEHSSGMKFRTLDLDVQYETPLGDRHGLVMGMGYRNTDTEFGETRYTAPAEQTNNLWSGFLQDEITLLADTLWLTLGTKYEYNGFTGSEWQPNARLMWKPADRHFLWTSVARAVRTPSLIEREGRMVVGEGSPAPGMPVFPFALKGNHAFDSESVIAYEAGYRWHPRSNFSLDLSLFYNVYDNLYDFQPKLAVDGIDLVMTNQVEGSVHGLELAADWRPTPWLSFAAAYSYLEKALKVNEGTAMPVGHFHDSAARHHLSLRSSIELHDDWLLNIWARASSGLECVSTATLPVRMEKIDGYVSLDANLIWTPTPNLELMLGGRNLFDSGRKEYAYELYLPPVEIRRSVFGKLTWKF